MNRAAAAALVVALPAAACTAGGMDAPSGTLQPSPATTFVVPSPVLAPSPFTSEDLPDVVLDGADTPPGTEYAERFSVDQPIEEFATDPEELSALRLDRFVLGRTTLFVPEGQLDDGAPPPEPGSVFVQSIAGVFEADEGADSALRRYVANLRAFQLSGEVRIDAEGLGRSSEGLRGRVDGERITVFAWRSANLVLVVSGSGTIPPGDVRELADRMQRRAERVR